MSFRVGEDSLEARMPPVVYRVKFRDIEGVEVVSLPWYIGWGLRVMGRRLAFVSRRGRAVSIKKRRGFFRELVLTVQNPERFAETVKSRALQKLNT